MNDTSGERQVTEDDLRRLLGRLVPDTPEARRRAFSAALVALSTQDEDSGR
jgi:hypothetical protein